MRNSESNLFFPIPEEVLVGEGRLLLDPLAVGAGLAALGRRLGLAAGEGELLLQVVRLPLPVLRGAEVGPGGGEGGIVPAAGEPAGIVDHPEAAEDLDEPQLRAVEEPELLVP